MNEQDLKSLVEQKLVELRLYKSQGLIDAAHELGVELYEQIGKSQIPEQEKERYLRLIEDACGSRLYDEEESEEQKQEPDSKESESEEKDLDTDSSASVADSAAVDDNPEAQFEYAKALMEIQDWDRAIEKFKEVAATGYRVDECYELCGDCAVKAGKWQDAIRYYEIVYSQPGLLSEDRERILNKISRCQKEKFIGKIKKNVQGYEESIFSSGVSLDGNTEVAEQLESLYGYVGNIAVSWKDSRGYTLAGELFEYELTELLHFGHTHAVFEAVCKSTGRKFAANALVFPWNSCVSLQDIIEWVYVSKMMSCDYLDIPHDVAIIDGAFFIIRDYYERSLLEYMKNTPHPSYEEASIIAYQILEGLGYLHLHLGRDKQKRKVYHLDLRPSRIFFGTGSLKAHVAYGGLWKIFNDRCGKYTRPRSLPLGFLPYKAPEQFRRFLWSERRPQVCVDIYSFGVIFYELLVGINPFDGKSVEEFEILHCDQKPIPPQVTRPDLPEELNDIVMKCLEIRPQKRWRSTTQILLTIEKFLGGPTRVRELLKRYSGVIPESLAEHD